MGRRSSGNGLKCVCVFLSAVLSLSGCGLGGTLPQGFYRNHILTMQPVEQDKMLITVRAEYNVNTEGICKAIEKQFPDTTLVPVFHCAQDTGYELRKSLLSGDAEDLIISPNSMSVSDIAPETMLDLSAEDYTENYKESALRDCEINGKLYYLPGPSALFGIIYDKTLFREKGWEVPKSYSSFLSLVRQINASGIRAIQTSCKYARQAQLVFTMFSYGEMFGGVDNAKWLSDYQNGTADMVGHLEPAFKRYQELNEAGIILPGDFDVQPGNRSDMFYKDGSCAMIVENEQAARYAKSYGSDHEYGMLPFWCADQENADHLMSIPSYYIGISAGLAGKENRKKLSKIHEILRWISTPEGQEALAGGKMTQISNVINTPYEQNDFYAGVSETLEKGNFVPEIAFLKTGNNNSVEKTLQGDLRKFLEGSMTAEEVEKACDDVRDKSLNAGVDRGEKAGSAKQNFSLNETGLFIADALREKAGADVGLCLLGTVHRGTVSRIYEGDICKADIRTLDLNVGPTGKDPNDKKLWVLSMTGKELKELLETACHYDPADDVPNIPYYVASGLKIRFAPWQEEKLLSVRTESGKALDDNAVLRVAMWGWPFEESCPYEVESVLEDSCEDILTEAVRKKGALVPDNRGRFELVYGK